MLAGGAVIVVEVIAVELAGDDVVVTMVDDGATTEVADVAAVVGPVGSDALPLLQAANMTALTPITIDRFTRAPITTHPPVYRTGGVAEL
ncbi:MAG TPA: hypothetical protein VLD86_08795 [Ilumatobacteraceae bacterium]|nr:hypothetical protein [Ilumatobacteraceae bacterium]